MGRIVTIIGTRPEIIKMAPVTKALDALSHENVLVHSGQHYDLFMDRIFFRDLALRDPDHQFELKDQPPYLQVANTMRQVGPVLEGADLVVTHGDTNTTAAGALLASKMGRPLAHVEAGLRSFDKKMPEEINRTIADRLSTLLFAPTPVSRRNLEQENINDGIHLVGNSVIDALLQNAPLAEKRSEVLKRLGLRKDGFILLTLHRAENTDDRHRLAGVLDGLRSVSSEAGLPIVFPIHPRTAKMIRGHGLEKNAASIEGLKRIEPTGYFDLLALEMNASLVMTDSGGLQEESCYFRVPCVTLRESTERPETLENGANVLAGTDPNRIVAAVKTQLEKDRRWSNPFGDGTTGTRIAGIVDEFLG